MKNKVLFIAYFNGPKLGVGEVMENLLINIDCDNLIPTILTNSNTMDSIQFEKTGLKVINSKWLNNPILGIIYFLIIFPFSKLYRNNYRNVFLANPIVNLLNRKNISVIHDLNEFEIKNKYGILRSTYRKYMIKSSIKFSKKIIVISNYVQLQINNHISNKFNNKIHVIYNGVKLNSDHAKVVPKMNCFVTIGRIDPKSKNLYEVIKLFKIINNNNNKFTLFLIGGINDSTKKEAQKFLSYIQDNPNIKYLGYVNDAEKLRYYKISQAAILLSKFEGFGLPLIEAFGYGCPVITHEENNVFREIGGNLNLPFKSSYINYDNEVDIKKIIFDYISKAEKKALREHANTFKWENTAAAYLKVIMD